MTLVVSEPLVFRDEPRSCDVESVRDILESTGFFSRAEVEVALELIAERLSRGSASDYQFLFVECAGQPLAYACFGEIACTVGSYDLFWIAVHASHRGRGLGRQLIAEVERRIAQGEGRRIYIETSSRDLYTPTRAFYERCGYQIEARLRGFYAAGDDKIVFCKGLCGS